MLTKMILLKLSLLAGALFFASTANAGPKPYQSELMGKPVTRFDLIFAEAERNLESTRELWERDIKLGDYQVGFGAGLKWLARPQADFVGWPEWEAHFKQDFYMGGVGLSFDRDDGTFLMTAYMPYVFPQPEKATGGSVEDFLDEVLEERRLQGLFVQNISNFSKMCRWMLRNMVISNPFSFIKRRYHFDHWDLRDSLEDEFHADISYRVKIAGSTGRHQIFRGVEKAAGTGEFGDVVSMECWYPDDGEDRVKFSHSGAWDAIEKIYTN